MSRRIRRPSPVTLSWVGLAAPLVTMGVLHATVPKPFDAIVPTWIPGPARFWTYASGAAEVAVGAAVAVPATRRVGALAAAGLFVAVFPANVQMAVDWSDRAWPWRAAAFGRLPLQIPMINHALRVRRDAS